ncbi:family 16 glycosylhydrolase [Nocardioides sp. zg-1228]|uniref:glycoside hydrolase family 16 protein n=1 Tax=Nocardioides sp. zg-1228 TaxID=2763008 RepID=UPI00164264BF|nr:family 16 glycosylhydrolase [Nocardioides sp. zg-1228]MBC2931646.1 family 16 glycosylhydrolase [Nocardioides sp. zg-1228]QSF57237.1 family 16 glycosylhydrolase [Nocardioides sp. zg-1228]
MSRTPRLVPRSRTRGRALVACSLGVALVTAGCSSSGDGEAAPPSYERSDDVTADVLPQLAANGEDVEAADDAAWLVDATVADVDEGTPVTLVARTADGWTEVDEGETDATGWVSLTSRASGDLHVVVGEGEDAIGAEVSTDDAPAATFTDDFDDDSVDVEGATWVTRDQGYIGVRTCSRASSDAAEVTDGVLRLSVLEDPDRKGDECTLPGRRKKFPYRLNGHVGTEGTVGFTYGFAAARIKTQAARGQHAAFWMQAVGGQRSGGPKKGGAEIDVIEYFGGGHPEGGLTSFTYYLDKAGKKQTVGGWLPDGKELGDDWAEQFHVFSLEWTPDEYVFRIDDRVTQRLEGPTAGRPEFLILSLLSSDYELPRFDGELPETMEVDWVRVWETGPKR